MTDVTQCPACDTDKVPEIKTEKRTFIYNNKVVTGPYNFYYCEDCEQGFVIESLEQGNIDKVTSRNV